jgi:hypothetical protein
MFYSATPELGSRKVTDLYHVGDPAWWIVATVAPAVELHFELINEWTGSLGRIICALTGSPVFHVETRLDDSADENLLALAESKLGQPYDFEGALGAWKDTGYHTLGKEFCSGLAYEIVSGFLQGLQSYPNPGKLLSQVWPSIKLAIPKIELTGLDYDYLNSLAGNQIATGTAQEIIEVLA